ncbi:hypothetical protein PF006_g29967, partial [Phytophthora fragariae]
MLESSRSTQTPPPIATPAATPGSSTETPAATPAPTIKVGAPAAIPTPADASGGSNRAVQRRRRLRLRLRRTLVEARVEPFDADAASDCDSGGHPWQLDGDTGSDSCSDDQGRSSSGYSDSGGRLWMLESSRSTQTPPPIATPAATPGSSTEKPAATFAPTIKVGAATAIPTPADASIDGDTGSDSCSDDQGRSSSGYSDSDGRLWRLESSRSTQTPPPIATSAATPGRSTETPAATPAPTIKRTPVEARVESFDADTASDCDSGGRLWRLESSRSTQTPPPIATPAATPGRSTETPAATPAPTIKVGAATAIPTPADASVGSNRAVQRRRRLRLRLRRTPVEARVEPFDADAASDCDFGGHPWQIDGDTGSDSCSDDQGRSTSGYSDSDGRLWRLESSRSTQTPPPIDSGGRQWRLELSRSTQTPPPIATPADVCGGSSRAVRRRRRLRLRLRRPPLAARRRYRHRLLLRRSRSEQQRLFRLRWTPVEARVEPFDADAASDCDLGGHPWQIDGDNGSDFCSDDQGRSSIGYSDSDGRLWRLESSRSTQTPPPIDSGGRQWRLELSRSTQTPPPIATPAATPGSSTETPAATPAPTIKTPPPIATWAATPGRSTETPAATPAPTIKD